MQTATQQEEEEKELIGMVLKSISGYDDKFKIIKKTSESLSLLIEGEYKGKQLIGKAFYTIPLQRYSTTSDCKNFHALIYENKIYTEVVPLLAKSSPNFIQKVYNLEIDYMKLTAIDETTGFCKLRDLLDREIIKRERENTIYCVDEHKISIFFMEKLKSSVTISTLLSSQPLSNVDIKKLIAQIILSFISMVQLKINHNDLHTGNILVETLDPPRNLTYKFSDTLFFEIKNVHYKIYIFDWDLAYSDTIKNNLYVETMEWAGMYNEWNPIYDIFTILCYISTTQSQHPDTANSLKKFSSFCADIFGMNDAQYISFVESAQYITFMCCRLPKKSATKFYSTYKDFVHLIEAVKNDPVSYLTNILEHNFIKNVIQ